jgi:type IV secretion system protein TrbE
VGAQLRSAGFLVLRESFHLWPAWCGSLPGQWAASVRWQFVSTANLADLCPLRTVLTGTATNDYLARQADCTSRCLTVLETEYRVPFHFNFHQEDLGHTMVVGPSRSGKSVFVNFLLSQFRRYHPANVFVFDKDHSCRIPTVLHGGLYVDPDDTTDALRVNPLANLSDARQREWVLGWLRRLLAGGGRRWDSADDRALRTALDDLAGLDASLWRLRTLYGLLPAELRDELERWVGDAGDGRYFDNAHDTLSFADWCAVEIGGLLQRDGLAPAFMDYAMHRISRALEATPPRPTAIYLEEAWFLVSRPDYAERVRDWLKTIPKRLGFVVLATQSLADVERSELFASIADNVPTRVFLPNRQADAFRVAYVERFGLRPAQIDRIRDAAQKRQYYIATPGGGRLVDVRFEPEMLAVLRSDALAQTVFSRHRQAGDDRWIDDYLREMAHVE